MTSASILILSADYPPLAGGVSSFCLGLEAGLRSLGCQVDLLTTVAAGDDPIEGQPLRMGTSLNRHILKILPLAYYGSRRAARIRPDWVLAMTCGHEGISAGILRSLHGIPYAVIAHGSELRACERSWARALLVRQVLRHADLVLANSRFTADLAIRWGARREKTVTLNPPVAPAGDGHKPVEEDQAQKLGLNGGRVLLTASRLVRRKGHEAVLTALSRLAARYPDLIYVATGRGAYAAHLARKAEELGVGDRFRLAGHVSVAQLRALYRRACIYVSPSMDDDGDVEGFGIALVEAGSFGLPVVAGRIGGVEDAIVDGVTGVLVDPGDVSKLERALDDLLGDEHLRRRLGEAGRQRAQMEFSVTGQARRLLHHLKAAS